jgi:hypothetical protein
MAKEDKKEAAVEESKVETPDVYPEGTVDIGSQPGSWNVSHKKKDGSDVVLTVITN